MMMEKKRLLEILLILFLALPSVLATNYGGVLIDYIYSVL